MLARDLAAAAVKPADELAAAVEPAGEAAATAVEPADESAAAVAEPAEEKAATQGLQELVSKPAAARKESWVINPAISSKVVVSMTREGLAVKATAEAVMPPEEESRRSLPGLEDSSAARQAAAESATPLPEAPPGPAAPAAGAQGKRKASTGEAEGSQKGKKSSPVGQ
jgi:hypothetical protein